MTTQTALFKYDPVERAFLDHADEALAVSLKDDSGKAAMDGVEAIEGAISDTNEAISRIVEAIKAGGRSRR